jgi:hypothetical protein
MAEQAGISYSLCQATIFTVDFGIRTVSIKVIPRLLTKAWKENDFSVEM